MHTTQVEPSTNTVGQARAFRAQHVDPQFSLLAHGARTLVIAGAVLGLGLVAAQSAIGWAWLLLPLFWAVANLFEWGIHRYWMHGARPPRVLYHNHALVHHRAFLGDEQEIEGTRDLSLVMMPWYTLVFVLLSASPIALTLYVAFGSPIAGIFAVAAVSYFLMYEFIHTLHHLPYTTLRRWHLVNPILTSMRRHHHAHHQLERMAHENFNVTWPLTDLLLGTYRNTDANVHYPSRDL